MDGALFFNSMKNKRVTIVGFGVSLRPLVGLLLQFGIDLTVCDKKSREILNDDKIEELEEKGVKFVLGEHYLDNLDADIIIKTPGMRSDLAAFKKAAENGTIITSEMEIFFEVCPCKIIAVTGSEGKTTSSTLIYNILTCQGYTCHLGGNIGKPLLPEIFEIKKDDFVIVELSSFQLNDMKKSADIALITNVTPNHLDWHVSMDEYIDVKRNIFLRQGQNGRVVLNYDNEITRSYAKDAKGEMLWFSYNSEVENGVFLDKNGDIFICIGGLKKFVMNRSEIRLVGDHHVENYMGVIAAVWNLVDIESIVKVAQSFGGVEHRVEFVRDLNNVKYYNDSIASTPTRTIAGLKAFDCKVILLAGGYDKKIPYEPLVPFILKYVKHLILMGSTAYKIFDALYNDPNYKLGDVNVHFVKNLDEGVDLAYDIAKSDDIVFLSPASASFDAFNNFEERGNYFKKLVNDLEKNTDE